jgi:hypothetical protein
VIPFLLKRLRRHGFEVDREAGGEVSPWRTIPAIHDQRR